MGAVYDEFQADLAGWRHEFEGRPRRELERLLLVAMEREQLVAVAYGTELMARRLATLSLSPELRALAEQALAWAWKDEQMHAIYTRGALLQLGSAVVRARARGHQMAGVIAGWASSVRQHLRWSQAPFSVPLATAVTWLGGVMGKVPRAVKGQLQHLSFADFCTFQVDAEHTAAACWERVTVLAEGMAEISPDMRDEFRRMWRDEEQHRRVFAVLAQTLGDDPPRVGVEEVAEEIRDIGEFFLPRDLRSGVLGGNPLGRGGRVFVVQGDDAESKRAVFRHLLEDSDLARHLKERAVACGKSVAELTVLIKPSFMLGYDRRDPSTLTDPELIEDLASFLGEQGCRDIAVAEGRTLYDRFYRNRGVRDVAEYFGIRSPRFRVVDLSEDQVPHRYARGMGQHTVSQSWRDADFRISFAKLRSHPIDLTHLAIAGLQGVGARFEDFLFAERQAHRDTALLMPLSEFPPHFALVEGYDSAGDGVMGIIACPRYRGTRRLYAGADALAVDMVATRHLGVADPRRSVILDSACHWFGDPSERTEVVGPDAPVAGWRSPYHSGYAALLSLLAWPVYQWASRRGELFVPPMDTAAFPPAVREGISMKVGRGFVRCVTGMRRPR